MTEGFLEAYLMGLTTQQERAEVEQLLGQDTELQQQLEELETDMEQFFMRHAVPPPPGLKNAVLHQLSGSEIQPWAPETQERRRPSEPEPTGPHYVHVDVDETHIRVHKYWRPAFIAVFVLSKIFLILGLYYYFKASSLEKEMLRMQAAPVQQMAPAQPAPGQ
ncbi:hypothetical protein GCM10027578_11020 [Spirosoma luteolum]